MAIFGSSEDDLERLRATVESLGTTSVPGLAAALSWRRRKAEKLLAVELGRPGTPLVYEPGRRTVRWGRSLERPEAEGRSTATADAPRSAPLRPRTSASIGTSWKAVCPACHVPLIATGSTSLAVCPQCGRIANPRSSPTSAPASTPAAPATPAPVVTPSVASAATSETPEESSAVGDRRAQELFAAYVTSQPIPCPKCRTPLKHRGVSEYVCPSCGHSVRFPSAGPPPAPSSKPTAVAAGRRDGSLRAR